MQRRSNTYHSARASRGQYLMHIDGISAIAVLPVVLLHVLAVLSRWLHWSGRFLRYLRIPDHRWLSS